MPSCGRRPKIEAGVCQPLFNRQPAAKLAAFTSTSIYLLPHACCCFALPLPLHLCPAVVASPTSHLSPSHSPKHWALQLPQGLTCPPCPTCPAITSLTPRICSTICFNVSVPNHYNSWSVPNGNFLHIPPAQSLLCVPCQSPDVYTRQAT